ncbi:MAG TPA: CvpA family protein [Candidatus Mcinerneyibacteriales bacterium]|nr:CvpA family protein [Candidatus Mcinerneyibacteriales bacterium]HPE20088.1 CvpA family protein [Candidatus Mcinerneyibacteriales bacterium]HPJ70889.1 CvpA family protein [Candidatus Mcinerneyibacteriales bacterium]HPQ88962.1 CvpA family protein [Candidatus Mcinerneyibacteriales bacterium]
MDVLLVVFLLISIAFSMKKGFFMEIFQLASLLIAYWAARNFYTIPADIVFVSMPNTMAKEFLSYALAFFIAFVLSLLIFSFIRKAISGDNSVRTVDKTMGAFFGILKGLIILEFILLLLLHFQIVTPEKVMKSSLIGKFLVMVSRQLGLIGG